MDLLVFLPLLLVLAAFMFFASRRQRRAMQATINLHESLRVGDRVHTTSGLQATVTAIGDDTVALEIAPGVVTTWMKLAIRDRIEPDEPVEDVEPAAELAGNHDAGAVELTGDANGPAVADPERLTKD